MSSALGRSLSPGPLFAGRVWCRSSRADIVFMADHNTFPAAKNRSKMKGKQNRVTMNLGLMRTQRRQQIAFLLIIKWFKAICTKLHSVPFLRKCHLARLPF